ncbi:Protein furry -like [Liparis tanakae]|uniref:Protein furry-like n=1 Tax=Liparis tanakae TaxID=230148 RepID=A0A4Z2EPF2_9TELE|nr:Protein furry -like [Liparis tanakae]
MDKGDTPSLQECQYAGSTPSLNLTNHEDTDESSEEEGPGAGGQSLHARSGLVHSDSADADPASNHVDALQRSQEEAPPPPPSSPPLPRADSPPSEAARPAGGRRPEDAVSVTAAADDLSEDTGFCSAPPLPPDPSEPCDPPDPLETREPREDLDPAAPPPPAIDTPPGSLCCEEDPQRLLPLSLPLPTAPETDPDPDPDPDSTCGSGWEEDVTRALKELDERCEEEEADYSSMSR